MHPIKFPEQTGTLQRPPNMTDVQCAPLPVFQDGEHNISCWQATLRERLRFLFTGRLWLWVLSGRTQPPVAASVEPPAWIYSDETD